MVSQGIRLGRLMGIEIRVSFSWFVIFGLVTVLLATAYFPQAYPNLPRNEYLILGFVTSFLFFVSVLLHELSHSVIARFNHINIRSITLFIFGGVAHMDEDPSTPAAEFLMAVAGPFASIILSGLFAGAYLTAGTLKLGVLFTGPLLYLAIINIYLAVFNLIPGYPLDGGRVLRAFLWAITKDIRRATRIASLMGQAFAMLLIFSGLYMIFVERAFWVNGLWFIFIGIFLQQVAAAGYEEVVMHLTLSGVKVKDIMTPDVVTVGAATMVNDLVNDYFMRYKHSKFPVVEGGAVIGVVTLQSIQDVPRDEWDRTRTRAVTPSFDKRAEVLPEMMAEEAIARMTDIHVGYLLVMEDGDIKGILTMRDLAGAIQMRRNLGV
ncbi:MAG: site-2 protease family protein [Actinomycetota bacterium]